MVGIMRNQWEMNHRDTNSIPPFKKHSTLPTEKKSYTETTLLILTRERFTDGQCLESY
jgi:hypothetical protein